MNDNFFTTLENTKPYLKVGFEGFAGSGKTYTAAQLAIGLHKRIGSTKPIAYFDTEKAGTHLRKVFQQAEIAVLYKPSRTLADLTETMKRGREGTFDILLIDSISHVWDDVLRTYQKQKGRRSMQFEDWNIVKPKWKEEFSEPFVHDRYHAIMCGRAGYEYTDEKDENGKRQIFKSGVKMKAEGETAYEPDMLVMMERHEEVLGKDKAVWREAMILKDRSMLLDGNTFKNPTFQDFLPSIEWLLDKPVEREPPPEQQNNFETDDGKRDYVKRKTIALETLDAELTKSGLRGTAQAVKAACVEFLERSFGTASKTQIEGLKAEQIEEGTDKLRQLIEAARKTETEAA